MYNKHIEKGIHSLEGLLLKLHLIRRAGSLEKTLMWEKIECKRRGQQKVSWLDSIIDSVDKNLSKLWETVEDGGAWHAVVHGVAQSPTLLSH